MMTVVSVEPPSPSVLHVEVAVKPTSSARFDIIRACVEESLKLRMIMPHSSVHFADIEFLKENVECVRTCEIVGGEQVNSHLYLSIYSDLLLLNSF